MEKYTRNGRKRCTYDETAMADIKNVEKANDFGDET
jgi:hypothetical protein